MARLDRDPRLRSAQPVCDSAPPPQSLQLRQVQIVFQAYALLLFLCLPVFLCELFFAGSVCQITLSVGLNFLSTA